MQNKELLKRIHKNFSFIQPVSVTDSQSLATDSAIAADRILPGKTIIRGKTKTTVENVNITDCIDFATCSIFGAHIKTCFVVIQYPDRSRYCILW